MTVSSLKRPRVDQLLLRDHSLSTIHPAKKLFIGNDSVSKILSKAVFSAEPTNANTNANASTNSNSNAVETGNVMLGMGIRKHGATSPFNDRTNLLQREKIRGFTTNGLLSFFGASNAVTQKLLPAKHLKSGISIANSNVSLNANSRLNVNANADGDGDGDGDANEDANETLGKDLAAARQDVLDRIRKVSFLTKDQKIRLMKQVSEGNETGLYGVQLKQFAKISEYLNQEQKQYVLNLCGKSQRR